MSATITAGERAGATTLTRRTVALGLLVVALVASFTGAVALGSVQIPIADTVRVLVGVDTADPRWAVLITQVRLPRAVTAALAGAALGAAGLQMQTLFRNALAEPYVLGVSSGASLGVALTVLTAGTGGAAFTAGLAGAGRLGTVLAAAIGAGLVMGCIVAASRVVRSSVTLLVLGVMIGSATTALISLLLSWAEPIRLQQYIMWGLGSFSAVAWRDLVIFAPAVGVGVLAAVTSVKSLNALLLGEDYARTMGLNVRRARLRALLSASVLAGTVTAFCGPVGFLGLAVPHLARRCIGTSDHRALLPTTLLVGAVLALVCAVVGGLPGYDGVIPVNVITALIGAPVVIAVLLRGSRVVT